MSNQLSDLLANQEPVDKQVIASSGIPSEPYRMVNNLASFDLGAFLSLAVNLIEFSFCYGDKN